jgi:hypothetical protein
MKKLSFTGWIAEGLWLLCLPVLLLVPGSGGFPYPPGAGAFSDIAVTHYPNARFLLDALSEWHSLPLWSSTILSGFPFAANPLSGLWYPPGWLALLLPLPFGFNLLSALHLLWGGYWMVRLLRMEGLQPFPAIFGGLAFEAMPKLFAHFGAGHLSLVYAVCWTPLLLVATRKSFSHGQPAADNGQVAHRRFIALEPGLVLALVILADVRWGASAGLLWAAAWGVWLIHSKIRITESLKRMAWQAGLALLLAAPLLIPLAEYTRLSTRAHLAASDVLEFSLPPARLLGLVFPLVSGTHEWVVYPGVSVLLLTALGMLLPGVRRRAGGWLVLTVLSLVLALGANIPGMALLSGLPGLNLLRAPSRWMFLFGLALAALAAHSLEQFAALSNAPYRRRASLLLTGLVGFGCLLALGVRTLTGSLPAAFAWGALLLLAAGAWLASGMGGRSTRAGWTGAGVLILLVDLLGTGRQVFVYRTAGDVLAEGSTIARRLADFDGLFRVYSPSYSLPQQSAAQARLQLADGVDPLQLQSYAAFMARASGVSSTGYSVTLPPFANGEPRSANREALPDPQLLGLLNIQYVASAFELAGNDLRLLEAADGTYLYENIRSLPRAWLQTGTELPPKQVRPLDGLVWSPNRIEIEARGPGTLVLAELDYPGWRVQVDGRSAEMRAVGGLLRGAELEAGEHHIVFEFRPPPVYSGMGLAAIGMFLERQASWRITRLTHRTKSKSLLPNGAGWRCSRWRF